MSFLNELKERFPNIDKGLAKGELSLIAVPAFSYRIGTFDALLRNRKLEEIGFHISDDPRIHDRIKSDGIAMNRKTYEFLVGNPELYPYYVHNIFRDLFGIEKLYDYELPPITKVLVPDLPTASAYIENFKFIMAGQKVKIPYEIKKTLSVQKGKTTKVVVELITTDV